ncbi:hypothetical protein SAMN05192583_0049 [Sphingomonas gellani]|uniref:Uncharacterized protein n=1 Tax=Sphingomonas gellani TaxID=1166340 RepID=A0A1H7Y3N5_9SPHN|nr:hypothetical protein [Sphingomonas gellani]SEM39957.1 hypothetical protein SAMN05192583_0049 [Sphingomonas gellani]
MTIPTIQITVDTKDAVQAVNDLHQAIERVNLALRNLNVTVSNRIDNSVVAREKWSDGPVVASRNTYATSSHSGLR